MPNGFVWSVVSFVNLAAIITGFYIGGYNGILEMDGFKDTFSHLYGNSLNSSSKYNQTRGCSSGNGANSDSLIGISVSSSNFGSFLGSLIAGWLSDQFSRKYGLMISGLVMVVGTTFLSAAFYVWMLIAGRFLSGIGIGIMYMVMPVYIAEMTPKESRGMLVSIIGPTYTVGICVILLANIGFAKFDLGWRVSFANTAFWGLVYAIGMAYMPHTPRWLVKNGRDHEALSVLSRINYHSSKDTFVDTFIELKELGEAALHRRNCCFLLKELFQQKYRLLLGCILSIIAGSTAAFMYNYSTTFFCEVRVQGFYAPLILGLVVVIATIVLTVLVDKLGRKTLFLVCTLLIFVAGLIVSILTHLYDSPSELIGYSIVVLCCIYAFGYACSWLTLPWIVNSEMFPLQVRGITVAIASGVYWFSGSIMAQITPIIIGSSLELYGYFYIISAIDFFAFFFVLFALPETKGVSLEKMDSLFSQSIWQRFVGTFRCSCGTGSALPDIKESPSAKAQEDFGYCQKIQEDSV